MLSGKVSSFTLGQKPCSVLPLKPLLQPCWEWGQEQGHCIWDGVSHEITHTATAILSIFHHSDEPHQLQ